MNNQLYIAFQIIETSVATHIDLEKETKKQVDIIYYLCCLLIRFFLIYKEKLMCSIFPTEMAHGIQNNLHSNDKSSLRANSEQFRKLYLNRSENVR